MKFYIDLIVIIAAIWFYRKWKAKKNEAERSARREAEIRETDIAKNLKRFDDDYKAFDKCLEDYHANRLFFPIHIETTYFEDIGGLNCRNLSEALGALVQDMEEADKLLEKYTVLGGEGRHSKLERCREIRSKYWGK